MFLTLSFLIILGILGFIAASKERKQKIKLKSEIDSLEKTLDLKEINQIEEIDFTDQLDIPISDIEENILRDILTERQRQFDLWGDQDYPSIFKCDPNRSITACYGLPSAHEAREDVEVSRELGYLSWSAIALEEFVEVVESQSEEERREELIQLTALLMGWIESIDRKSRNV